MCVMQSKVNALYCNVVWCSASMFAIVYLLIVDALLWSLENSRPFPFEALPCWIVCTGSLCTCSEESGGQRPPFAIPWLCSFGALPVACADDPTRPVGPILHQQNRLANETLEPRPFFLIILPERGCIQSMDRSMFALHTNYMPQTTN